MKFLQQGQLQIYTGKGKGKTTAAFGLAFRAAGNGYPVFIGQFLKAGEYGEHRASQWSNGLIQVAQFGQGGFVRNKENVRPEDILAAQNGLSAILQAMQSRDFAVVIADEINVAVHYGLLTEAEVIGLIKQRPPELELVLTGRYATDALIALADLVTELVPVKHYFTSGLPAREGIER